MSRFSGFPFSLSSFSVVETDSALTFSLLRSWLAFHFVLYSSFLDLIMLVMDLKAITAVLAFASWRAIANLVVRVIIADDFLGKVLGCNVREIAIHIPFHKRG